MEAIWSIYVSPTTSAKINGKHHVTEDEVREVCHRPINSTWVYDEERGRRLFLEGRTERGRVLLIVLYPTYQYGSWNLGTAYPG